MSHDEFVPANNLLRQYSEMKKKKNTLHNMEYTM